MSNKLNTSDIATKVAKVLISNPDLLDHFKGNPYASVENISGVNGISIGDMGGILDVLLAGSNEGGGLLGDVAGTLLKGNKTKSGSPNVVGELIKQVVGKNDSKDLMTTLLITLLTTVITGQLSNSKDKPSTTKKSSTTTKKASGDTKKSSSTKKTEGTTTKKTTTTKPKTSSKKKEAEPDLLGGLKDVLDSSGIDISELITNLLVGNKK